tara:strand:- start:15968 stop:17359 length:1392 start_codon:yes stop_codon:yes gene_type:complete
METSILQQKVAQQRHLLPSQQELLNRLLFQLAFNNFQNIGLVGAEGSGKSTLALAIAELFSEQANVALLTAANNEQAAEQQLLQQWFGQRQAEPKLADHLATPLDSALPLLLIVDNFSQLSTSTCQKLLLLDCLGIFLLDKPSADMALNLSINVPTLQDAGQILKDKPLDPLAVAERFAASAGNMHLLHSAVVKPEERKSQSAAFWLIPVAIVLLIVAGLVSWYLPEADKVVQLPLPKPETLQQALEEDAEPASQPVVDVVQQAEIVTPAETAAADSAALAETILTPADAESVEAVDDSKLAAEQTSALSIDDDVAVVAEPVNQSDSTIPAEPDELLTLSTADSDAQQAQPGGEAYQDPELLTLPATYKVLQLAVLSSAGAVERFRQTYPTTEIIVYQRSWQGQLQWVILAQKSFPDVASARAGRSALAEPLRTAGPFIKPVAAVQQEIKALGRLQSEPVVQE